MVSADDRNNLVIAIVVIATVIIASLLINGFIAKMQQVSEHGEKTMDKIGNQTSRSLDTLVTNVTNATAKSSANSRLIVSSMNNMSHSVNNSILNLNKTVKIFKDENVNGIDNLTGTLSYLIQIFQNQIKEQHETNLWLKNISKQLNIVPTVPVPNPPKTADCIIKTPTVCITAGGQIITNHK